MSQIQPVQVQQNGDEPHARPVLPSGVTINGDRRQVKNRFGWVRRLMQGQSRQSGSLVARSSDAVARPKARTHKSQVGNSNSIEEQPAERRRKHSAGSLPSFDSDFAEVRSDSDQTTGSDNISTTPLKSIVSAQSTKSPSILSNVNNDQNSLNASTAETSIAPSVTTNYVASGQPPALHSLQDRDSESIVTLASSSRRIRRRSIDTNCSTAGIPPASIMERLSVQPTTANSTYAVSVRTSQLDPSQSSMYDSTDQTSSVRSVD
ncbi:uncharacterized protein CANTADRAFT_25340 [Suhomyces tanzawaensis NRRL Y-17324]|uniref:Uncharacterized protein n=1 Tax=Suhomyces tanzawaensis NRRL Y-17324 TaxID=984487 RepID=A0A1E4SNI0_9ASCO|nr:uncharacterized protein CANTADRAFT_25340 [Suhomyces tanzawaensis NRRL Y-17324]ODV81081.1 hypothetical protein CANTADRAFT_25340 [Suhomyces tanzawaensis NRRL Y-17324]